MTIHQEPPLRGQGTAGAVHPIVARLVAVPAPDPAEIDALLAKQPVPLVEPGAVTFVYRGSAEHVDLVQFIRAGADRSPLQRVPDTDLWVLRLAVEDGGRFEYKLALRRDGHEAWITDPLNAARAGDPFGENSVCRTYGYERPAWTRPQGAPAGRIEALDVDSSVFGGERQDSLYVPAADAPPGGYPLLVIHDGDDFMTYADLAVSLDNLIAAGDIPPLIAAMVQSRDRMAEYPRGRRHARYIAQEVLPAVAGRFRFSERAEDRVLLGASLGAVASLATAFRYPGVFGGLVLKSGSFILDDEKLGQRPHPVFHRVARLVRALRRAPNLPPTRAFVSTGELEGLADENRALAEFLRARGVDVLFKSAWDGHHWHNWRDQLRDGLMWVYRTDEDNKT